MRKHPHVAPARPGTYTVTATTTDASGRSASAVVTVKSPDLDGDGQVAGDLGDLALLADAYRRIAPPEQDPADLNGDGVVDDLDVAQALADFEKPPAAPAAPRPAPARP